MVFGIVLEHRNAEYVEKSEDFLAGQWRRNAPPAGG